ncbi:hypothetical protein ACQ1Z2_14720, partial [Enterococcus faecalis]|uniref:hypothetical protein n=1 Tax=Enterococcus faecalis TaxID=1351 RepID=UPI003D6AE49F
YFDVISDDGDYAIAYWGTLRLPVLSATYSELSSSLLPEPYSRFQLSLAQSPPDQRSFSFGGGRDKLEANWVAVAQANSLA